MHFSVSLLLHDSFWFITAEHARMRHSMNILSIVPTPFRKPICTSAICSSAIFCILFSRILRSILLAWLIRAIVRCSLHFSVPFIFGIVIDRSSPVHRPCASVYNLVAQGTERVLQHHYPVR